MLSQERNVMLQSANCVETGIGNLNQDSIYGAQYIEPHGTTFVAVFEILKEQNSRSLHHNRTGKIKLIPLGQCQSQFVYSESYYFSVVRLSIFDSGFPPLPVK